jgi:serine protease AprX
MMNQKVCNSVLVPIVLVFFINPLLFAQNANTQRKADAQILWIYFKDKGSDQLSKLAKPTQLITERAIKRRAKVKAVDQLVNTLDLPVYEPYVNSIKPYVTKIRAYSKWLNAVSVEIESEQIDRIKNFKFIKNLSPVHASKKYIPVEDEKVKQINELHKKTTGLDYGASATQLELINVPALHEMGYYGQGVLICMLDDGFNLLNYHIAFDSLDVVATWDFINDDASVDDTEFSGIEGWHGTKTLSSIAGYAPGLLIGPAFKASYLLAKTEVDTSETPIEEDYWVEGIEWAENQGADIASSSLGYIDWYTWEDMDGETAVTTIAADLAVANGMIVVNSAGNEYDNALYNTLIAPADGKKVIAVGAVTGSGIRSAFSSVGPTADGRIKPDVAAMGSSVVVASSSDSAAFTYSSGTSFSCPLTAGAIALLLNANPDLTPAQVYAALTSTASQSASPDKYLGYGIINIKEAYYAADTAKLMTNNFAGLPGFIYLSQNYPNPFNPKTTIAYTVDQASEVEIKLYNLAGQLVETFPQGYREAIKEHNFRHDYSNLASGIYIYEIAAKELATGNNYRKTNKMVLLK